RTTCGRRSSRRKTSRWRYSSARCLSVSASSSPPLCTRTPVAIALFVSILLVAACGLIYELIAGTVASYLVGDSVFQFSTVIGTYLFAMGIGSFLSRFVQRHLARQFVAVEILIAVIGGFSSSALFLAFAF